MKIHAYRPEIDGLRALAILPVLFFHAGFLKGGYIGVDIFFVISGYLITSLILKDLEKNEFSLINFYERRARRILPALYLVMLVSIYPAWELMFPNQLSEFGESLIATNIFASNFLFWSQIEYFSEASQTKPLLHTWSLSIEEQFYILFPVLLLICSKYFSKRLVPIIITLGFFSFIFAADLSSTRSPQLASINFYFPIGRAWELLAGALVAINIDEKNRKIGSNDSLFAIIGFLLVVYSYFVFNSSSLVFMNYNSFLLHPGLYTVFPVIGTCLVILYSNKDNFIGKLLSIKYFVGIGLISYSLYLWHFTLFSFTKLYSVANLSDWTYLLLITLTFILSFFSWKFIETPFRNKSLISTKIFLGTSLILFSLFLSLGYLFHTNDGYSDRFINTIFERYLKAEKSTPPLRKECQNDDDEYWSCIIGDKESEPSIAMVGDSHRLSLDYSLHKILVKEHKSAYVFDKCSHLPNLVNYPYCNGLSDFITKNSNIKTVILHYRYEKWLQIDDLKSIKLFNQFINSLNFHGVRLVILYPVPVYDYHIPRTLFKLLKRGGGEDLFVSYNDHLERQEKAIKLLDDLNQSNIVRGYPDKILCNTFSKERCVFHSDKEIFYFDSGHLSIEGADLVMNPIFYDIIKGK
jgi:peptidoglycan/LPS O-acetylase OafA/YrhL